MKLNKKKGVIMSTIIHNFLENKEKGRTIIATISAIGAILLIIAIVINN